MDAVIEDCLSSQGISPGLIESLRAFRARYPSGDADRLARPLMPFYGREILEMGICALLSGQNLLLSGPKASGKNVLAENLAFVFGRPLYTVSFHEGCGSDELIGTDTFTGGEVRLRPGTITRCAREGGFGVLDEINMARNDAVSVLHACLDLRRLIDIPGYELVRLHPAARFIAAMNVGYAGTRELNEALLSRFLVIEMPAQSEASLSFILDQASPLPVRRAQADKSWEYVQRTFGRPSLDRREMERISKSLAKGPHEGCRLYFTEGILKDPPKKGGQYEVALRLRKKNRYLYGQKHREVKKNIRELTLFLKNHLLARSLEGQVLSDAGLLQAGRCWRVGKSPGRRLFKKVIGGLSPSLAVDLLIDASGSQMLRQGEVALQAYILSAALSGAGIPHRVLSYCSFWDYTVLTAFRSYEDPPSFDENLFDYVTSSNNRDGLAIRAAARELRDRREEQKILIILSDGRPNDPLIFRGGQTGARPYAGERAVSDTARAVQELRREGIFVLGVFAGKEKDLPAEKKIFGRDFACIRSLSGFAPISARYLGRLLAP